MKNLCLITGGGTGIGAALAVTIAERGLSVLITGRTRETLEETKSRKPERIHTLVADVSVPHDRDKTADMIRGRFNLKYIVHNAGTIEPIGPLKNLTVEQWRQHQAVNLEGPLFLTQTLLPLMESGRVLHMSSGAAHHAYAGWGAYCLSKAAFLMLYKVYNQETEASVRHGSLRPGVVDTPMQDVIRSSSKEEFPQVDRFINFKNEGILADPETVARFTAWVLLDSSDEEFSADEWDIRDETHHKNWK